MTADTGLLTDHYELTMLQAALASGTAHRRSVFELFPRLWAERQNVQELRLKELGRKAGERLVRQVLGDTVGSDTVERLVKQADGNAFYLEELIRTAAEGKDVGKGEQTNRQQSQQDSDRQKDQQRQQGGGDPAASAQYARLPIIHGELQVANGVRLCNQFPGRGKS